MRRDVAISQPRSFIVRAPASIASQGPAILFLRIGVGPAHCRPGENLWIGE